MLNSIYVIKSIWFIGLLKITLLSPGVISLIVQRMVVIIMHFCRHVAEKELMRSHDRVKNVHYSA